jgi:hypothetical protein
MEQNQPVLENKLDTKTSKPITSRFYFLLGFFGIFVFAWSGCYSLYNQKFQSGKDVPVNESSAYEPKYK